LERKVATFRRFEKIKAWQKAREVTRTIYQVTADEACAKDFGLRDQIRRAAVSIMANIAEGYGRRSNREFASFLNIAHGSAAEAQSHLYVALDLNYINQDTFNELYELFDEISRMIMALSQHLRASTS
jgi:four helix bundle protein